MNLQNILSTCAFALLVIMVLIRAAMLRRRGIRAIVFGATDKGDFLLIPIVLSIVYTILPKAFSLPMWPPLVRQFWSGTVSGWCGLALCGLAITGFALALASFGDSFRVGIDAQKPDTLVTTGVFAISRNPIYVCFLLFSLGQFLIHRNIVLSAAALLFALTIHRQVLREEKFLREHYGAEYEAYCRKVRRYLRDLICLVLLISPLSACWRQSSHCTTNAPPGGKNGVCGKALYCWRPRWAAL